MLAAHSNVHEVPIGRVTIVSAVLAQRRQPSPVLEDPASYRYGLEELGQGLILGEMGLEEEARHLMLRGTFGTGYAYRRISGADRLFLVREVLPDVGAGFIDKVHVDCDDEHGPYCEGDGARVFM